MNDMTIFACIYSFSPLMSFDVPNHQHLWYLLGSTGGKTNGKVFSLGIGACTSPLADYMVHNMLVYYITIRY